ncbi:hypothetical protein K435DRAFT_745488 [Dendrothele bispora CBS 962.96]|uniref:Uncharacterized protein n=1 Tax=Dendrothele bispora (strain CBS 962.96) TaxID=1314807 RepID=A0A4S8MQR0_DENBC|nr:hypothetical protein K435DRAFT_745488 [Dendrothele bispora CBS 962.96]
MPLPPLTTQISSTSIQSSSSQITNEDAPHILKRFFIGPMPENVLSQRDASQTTKKRRFSAFSHSSHENEQASRIIKNYALRYFLNEGGREENWGEQEERSTREEMLRRWQESEWGRILSLRGRDHANTKRSTTRWVGTSFEVGDIVGVNVFLEAEALKRISSQTSAVALSSPYLPLETTVEEVMNANTTINPAETFVTAPTEPPEGKNDPQPSQYPASTSDQRLLTVDDAEAGPSSPSSSTALLPRPPASVRVDSSPSEVQSEPPTRRPIIHIPSFPRSEGEVSKGKSKSKKAVHYDLSPINSSPVATPVPASPTEVLERTYSEIADTSAGTMTSEAFEDDYMDEGGVILRDRMLVRIYSNGDRFPVFTEEIHRTTKELRYEDWAEFLVVWRKGRIELYNNHTMPGKEWITGHKYLSYTILLENSSTYLSLYSFVDLSFCLTALPTRRLYNPFKSRWDIKPSKEGTNIFIFKLKSRSRAYDWVWRLWRAKGNDLPPSVEVQNPRLESRVKINIPALDTTEVYRVFSRDNIIGLCIRSLSKVGDWKYVIEREMSDGKALQLAWRNGTFLDWIWLDKDVDGRSRKWSVLCGLAVKQQPLQLEIRIGEHYPSFAHLKNGEKILEPPAIEGYLSRIKPATRSKEQVYLCTHGAYLFSLRPSDANPPIPLGMGDNPDISDDPRELAGRLRKSETERGVTQIMKAMGVGELTSILAVRRATHTNAKPTHTFQRDEEVHPEGFPPDEEPEDDGDEGGPEVMSVSEDQNHLKMKRSFELLLDSGHVVRFETNSRRLASEWVTRLRALISFWKARLKQDTKDEMELAQTRRPRVTPLMHVDNDHILYSEALPDDHSPLPTLGSFYNWCVLEGCRPIVRNGKVFMRQGLSGGYRLTHLFLLPEYLVQFRIAPKSSLQTTMRKNRIPLLDAYVFSGYFAAQCFPPGQFDVNAQTLPRRYQDGLEVDDSEEERLFIICYRTPASTETKQPVEDQQLPSKKPSSVSEGNNDLDAAAASNPTKKDTAVPKPPSLDAKRKFAIFRTRSRLERDAWIYALNTEIEKIVRRRKDWESRVRNEGGLMDI